MQIKRRIILLIILAFACAINVQAANRIDTLRVLAIGNSFSQDAVEQYLYELAEAAGKPIIIGNLYIGGAPLSRHWKNVQSNKAAYSYRKIGVTGEKTTRDETSILQVLRDEQWDYISFQQASSLSGKFDTYRKPLTGLYRYIDSVSFGEASFLWHQTWAYASNSTHKGFANYDNDQQTMYEAIMKASSQVKTLIPIDQVVPCGTAIQNARTSFIGDHLTRDGYHLDLDIGRFIAACTWFEALFGQQVPIDRYRPDDVSEAEAEVARQAAHAAVLQPFSVTDIFVEGPEAIRD